MPHEYSMFGVLFSPWLPAVAGACALALLTVWLLNITALSRFFRLHQGVFLAVLVLYASALYRWGME